MKRFYAVLCGLVLAALPSTVALADTIASTLGPGQTYNTSTGWLVWDSFLHASPFVPTETVTLTDATLGIQSFFGSSTTPWNVFIESSTGSGPGNILDTLSQVGTVPADDTSHLVDFTCSTCSQLDAGTTYYLVAQQGDASTFAAWDIVGSLEGPPTPYYSNSTNSPTGPWSEESGASTAFEVNGTTSVATTPEPSSLFLLGTGVLGIAGTVRRKFAL